MQQEGVWEYLSDSVDSFVQGYNVSILAYGQSGAGKSYTMGTSGPEEQNDSRLRGIVPRAATVLFEKLTSQPGPKTGLRTPQRYSTHGLPTLASPSKAAPSDKNWQLKATYVEIYNEQLRDLLVPESVPLIERAQVSIREDTKGRILLTGLTQIEINSVEDLFGALNFGSSIRQTDATAINAKSSRSHAVFSLNLVQKRTTSGFTSQQEKRFSVPIESMAMSENSVVLDSKLHFVDLAGSERMKNTGASGDRAKEGISINAGLASLGKVISQLSSKQGAHVSYRDSRLTRLLQDSLGGNAITYMIACITDAEFHLSETLNTVHYAQRARAIQSKPVIQQTTTDSDKQAIIDRLQAEVMFLRDQVSHERAGQRNVLSSDRPGQQEADLQNRLLDMQESYNALSQRHARLVSEMGKDHEGVDAASLNEALGAGASERLARSSSFAEAVEQVVMEYEKTIQSLEGSLSNTRSHLSSSESTLMERESKIAYMESITQQLQTRLHKMSERESNNDAYLHNLETQIAGATTSEEKSSTLVSSLRKELGRAKDNQTSSEDYISTLEERLAEAEQDQEIMQRELDRLEHVIERQRSIGRLDNLLADLDVIRMKEAKQAKPKVNGHHVHTSESVGQRDDSPPSPVEDERHGFGSSMSVPNHNHNSHSRSPVSPLRQDEVDDGYRVAAEQHESEIMAREPIANLDSHHVAQSNFMADKLETLTQELFDLRGEHETTQNEHDELQRKYAIALQTLAKLQDSPSEEVSDPTGSSTPQQPEHFLADAGVSAAGGQNISLSSRSLSLGSSLQEEHKTLANKEDSRAQDSTLGMAGKGQPAGTEVEALRQAQLEKDASIRELTQSYAKLHQIHQDALNQVEDLKSEVQRAQTVKPSSPLGKPMVRRKPSQDVMSAMGNVDRANRSFASLRNIALDHFETNTNVRQNFELQLTTIMTELHNRTEKTQSLEAELTAIRKDMDGKTAMIAGLTRERSALKASSNIDFSVVGRMRDQLVESEQQVRTLHESHAARESHLQSQLDKLRSELEHYQKSRDDEHQAVPGGFPETPALENAHSRELGLDQAHDYGSEVARMQQELAAWETRHNESMSSMNASEEKLLATIATLEASVQSVSSTGGSREVDTSAMSNDAAASLEHERAKHAEVVATMQRQIDDHQAAGQEHAGKLAELETSHANILKQVESDSQARDLSSQELQSHRDLVNNLESQLAAHKSTIESHEKNLESLKTQHAAVIEEHQASLVTAEKHSDEQQRSLQDKHNALIVNMEADLKKHQTAMFMLLGGAAAALGHETDSTTLHNHIKDLVNERRNFDAKQTQATNDMKAVQDELQSAQANYAGLQTKMGELRMQHEQTKAELSRVADKEQKSSRLVQELEDQLNSTFDQTRRLSVMQTEKHSQLEQAQVAKVELEKEVEDSRLKISLLEVCDNSGTKVSTC